MVVVVGDARTGTSRRCTAMIRSGPDLLWIASVRLSCETMWYVDPLSEEELHSLASLLRRFADADLDQFVHWRLQSKYGPVFVAVQRKPFPGVPEDAYGEMA